MKKTKNSEDYLKYIVVPLKFWGCNNDREARWLRKATNT
jgi:hypothetical protein